MTIEEIYKSMRDKADAMIRERERIINSIENIEDSFRMSGELGQAQTCRSIVDYLRRTQ